MQLPAQISLCEVGPRDGFQYEDTPIPTGLKLEIIASLVEAGLKRIQAVSFVHPGRVPQMADAEEICSVLSQQKDAVIYSGLVLNHKGMERALATPLTHIDISIATNEEHSRNNTNLAVEEAVHQALDMVEMAVKSGVQVQVGFQTVFGYQNPGDTPLERVIELCSRFIGYPLESLSLADTTGLASPKMIQERVPAVNEIAGRIPIVLHLHDTRGLGLANIYAALSCGITRFDTSLGGMGGCPFIPGAAGNVATEDVAYLFESIGVPSGIDIKKVAACTRRMETFLAKTFPGKLHHLV